ncbi:LysR family transcriptional regulator [Cupriavidus plantarum]|uniref:LysR family transcriptional regulator n=1 Tax=Cupriavidus plantarum TaxID=942865 RepID=UPI0015C83705|nr:LysR family transcriptional regulator [Cupriavidus plantarum]NYI02063.1 DNA-binding transcriptional LysR family regulator [Cupriavidus plantarum]CAG2139337.1 HTH-type transcriptional regulator CysL [Cupriavidus plantarum]SMR85734.1 DNA-binding transcriptional regulator, LysR family [Cupriavidus plantarum]
MKQNGLDLDQLRAFLAVADKASFRRAAEALFLSAPALSRRVELLEERLGARLLERTSRTVRLTSIGASFRERAQAALDDLDAAAFDVARLNARFAGRVTVSCIPSVALGIVPAAMKAIAPELPNVRIHVLDESAAVTVAKVRDGEADFGIAFLAEPAQGLVFDPVVEDPFVLVAPKSHRLAARRRVKLASLVEETWLALSRTSGNRLLLNRALADRGIQLTHAHEAAHISSLLAMVDAGLGLALLPSLAVARSSSTIATVRLSDFALSRSIGIVSNPSRRLPRPATVFRQAVERALRASVAANIRVQ